MPYRERKGVAAVAPTTGAVVDMVRQFADRWAFWRELVQNGIDAGATHIEARATLEASGLAHFSVEDDGAGMTRAIIEGPLLTLFASSKEADASKIGKYGVGFLSVFAVEPSEVVVHTWRAGQAWVVRLSPDHSYELSEASPRPGSGTIVTLLDRLDTAAFGERARAARGALARWCRHAAVPIRLTELRPAADPVVVRIDEPLTVPAAFTVSDEQLLDDGASERFVLGPSAGWELVAPEGDTERRPSFAGFYNRGLTLHETEQPPHEKLANIRLKVLSPRLSHTLSRDGLRRDAEYERVVAHAVDLVASTLAPELARAIHAAAERALEEPARLAALLAAASRPPLALAAKRVHVPLTGPFEGKRTIALHRLDDGAAIATAADALTEALGAAGHPVVHAVHPRLGELLAAFGARLEWAHTAWVTIAPRAVERDSDRALCAALEAALRAVGVRLDEACLGQRVGARPPCTAFALSREDTCVLRRAGDAKSWLRRNVGRLVLPDDLPMVLLARRKAESDPRLAGQLLARLLWLEARGPLDEDANDALLALGAKAS